MLTAPSRLRISCSRVLMPILFGRCGDYSFPSMFYFWQSWKKKWDDSHLPHIVKLLEAMQASKPEGINIKYSRGLRLDRGDRDQV